MHKQHLNTSGAPKIDTYSENGKSIRICRHIFNNNKTKKNLHKCLFMVLGFGYLFTTLLLFLIFSFLLYCTWISMQCSCLVCVSFLFIHFVCNFRCRQNNGSPFSLNSIQFLYSICMKCRILSFLEPKKAHIAEHRVKKVV